MDILIILPVINQRVHNSKKPKILQMKITSSFISKTFKSFFVVSIVLSMGYNDRAIAQDGEKLFQQNCASCHKPDKDMTGPALKGARQRWIDNPLRKICITGCVTQPQ